MSSTTSGDAQENTAALQCKLLQRTSADLELPAKPPYSFSKSTLRMQEGFIPLLVTYLS